MSYIGANELVFNNDTVNGIHTGGFSVNSIMMKNGISPIMTINKEQTGGSNLVSDIFNNLVVPNWTLSYDNKTFGGKHKNFDNDSDEDEVIDDDLHDKLLELVKEHESKIKEKKKRATKKHSNAKKGGNTKKNK
jgi:hypothetical protein